MRNVVKFLSKVGNLEIPAYYLTDMESQKYFGEHSNQSRDFDINVLHLEPNYLNLRG